MAETSCFDHLLGLLSHTVGNLDRATIHFEDALAFCRKAGYRPELAWTCCDYADALVHRNNPGDHAKAMSLLEESLYISGELGMRPLTVRAASLQEKAQLEPVRAAEYPGGLTKREVEVLQLIAGGKSNSEIAEGLVLSVRTVERHITNIYAKINARGRADATSYALSHGLAH
jgi:DNA-binding CsgD family transcriptional regulator